MIVEVVGPRLEFLAVFWYEGALYSGPRPVLYKLVFTMAIPSLYDGENALDTRELNWISVQMGSSKIYGETMIPWDGIGLLVVIFLTGVLFGYLCAVRVVGAREKAMMMERIKQRRTVGTQLQCVSSRSLGTQSQCTYKWKLLTPRFQVLPQLADGAFVESFKSREDD